MFFLFDRFESIYYFIKYKTKMITHGKTIK